MGNSGVGDESVERQQALVDKLIQEGNLSDPRVEAAFRAVPRHLFLPDLTYEQAYRDEAIPTKRLPDGEVVSSSSQPAIMAIMLEQLGLEPGQRVLEIGAGTGYNAALLAYLVGETGQVTSIDIDEDIVEAARLHLHTAGYARVQVVCGDGALGYLGNAPYDRIMLTVAAWDIAPAWREQLKQSVPAGRLVLPLDIRGSQKCVALQPEADHLLSLSVRSCAFVGLRGSLAAPQREQTFGPDSQIHLMTESAWPVDGDTLYSMLNGASHNVPTGLAITQRELYDGVSLWLAIHEANYCTLAGEGEAARSVPLLVGYGATQRATLGLLGEDSLALLIRQPSGSSDGQSTPHEAFDVQVRQFGPDQALAHQLVEQLVAWDAAGRPGTDGLRLRVYRREAQYLPSPGEIAVEKLRSTLVLDWA